MKRICVRCNHDNSLHSSKTCVYCGYKRLPKSIKIKGFHLIMSPEIFESLKYFEADVISEENKITITISGLNERHADTTLRTIKQQYADWVKKTTCKQCGGLFCEHSNF